MLDLQNPTSQFHSYQPPDAIPHGPGIRGGWRFLKKVGFEDSEIESLRLRMESLDVEGSWNRARDYARQNPGKVLGGVAVLLLGAGLLVRRAAKSEVENRKSKIVNRKS